MRKKRNSIIALTLLVATAVSINAAQKDDGTMTKVGNSYVVNTTTLGADVKGYRGSIETDYHKRQIGKNRSS